jgi:glycosyltransferase involved in cell wall biosynthesis
VRTGPVNDRVSVVIATYNMGQYLPQAVESVLAQSYFNVEVQIVDDGSTDHTAQIAQQWEGHSRVRVHRQANRGQARAKNQGIELTLSPFVAFLDADDVWLPEKLSRQMPLFEGRPELGVVYSDYECMDGEGRALPKVPTRMHRGHVSGPLLIENFVSFPTAVVRRECLERHRGFDESLGMGIDYDLWLRLSAHYQFDFISEPTVRYRIWAGQMSKNYRKRYESAMRIMRDFLANNPGAVDPEVVRSAWAHTYTGRGNVTLWQESDRVAAFRDYLRALSFKPVYWPAWRSMLRSFITKRAP